MTLADFQRRSHSAHRFWVLHLACDQHKGEASRVVLSCQEHPQEAMKSSLFGPIGRLEYTCAVCGRFIGAIAVAKSPYREVTSESLKEKDKLQELETVRDFLLNQFAAHLVGKQFPREIETLTTIEWEGTSVTATLVQETGKWSVSIVPTYSQQPPLASGLTKEQAVTFGRIATY